VDIPDAFNWSRFNNRAAEAADGDFLLFLNDDIEIVQPDWLDSMMEHAVRPEVGMVGPQLLYPDRQVQHAGMFLATNGIGRHAFRFNAADEPGYFGLALTQRNVIAVTGACMLVRREVFERLGRFDEAHEIINNDVDFCLRAHRAGLRAVFTPYASLIHHELASRARLKDVFDLSHFNAQWKTLYAAGDPYFNPRLSKHADDYRPDDEPVQAVFPGHPLFDASEIRRILVVKLDHIGDFVTALPAMRKLKQAFPQASITVLAGRGSRPFIALEPSIDAFLEFDFFHARSQLGERALTAADFEALRDRLAPYRFDLAVDLRKHLSTRDVLRYTGARFLAGFDFQGQFPFLDIALEWDGDKALQRKRGHVVDDLLALVGAVASAASAERQLIEPAPQPTPIDALPEALRPLFDRPVIAVHPGAGNVTKQWPTEHFVSVIDLLTERDGVNIVLVGGPDEVELADAVLISVQHPERVLSVAGKTTLIELTELLTACTLYIGNDSGPKHIAAAIGVPTIGIHSGVVDAAEWAPLGRRTLALRRNMTCAPCYLANAEDCPRNLACLRFLEPSFVYQAAQMLLARPVAQAAPVWPEAKPPAAAGTASQPAVTPARSDKGHRRARRRTQVERVTA
jgi:lipopolysaccharide heptosyltransferase II